MSNKHIDELLQQCIAAFDAGLTPDECLSAYPLARPELEPLLRQALSLRVAFAVAPRPEFRERTREMLMFAAGRDVSAAFANEPDSEFVTDARQRFILAAGADMQEALRAVPPPRLPFWSNARRRLLDTAQRQGPRPAGRVAGGAFALRAGLSAAVVVLAMAVAGLAYISIFNAGPSASAELNALERDLRELENQAQAGTPISPAAIQDVAERTNKLVGQIDSSQESQLVDKLPALIERQKEVVRAASDEGTLAPELVQAQAQLNQTAEKVEEIRLAAARAEATATAAPSTAATAGQTPVAATGTPAPLGPGQLRITPVRDDATDNQAWKRLETANLSFVVPATWQVLGVTFNANGLAEFETNSLRIDGQGIVLIVNAASGNLTALIGTQPQLTLRGSGSDGQVVAIDQQFFDAAGDFSVELKQLLDSLELSGALLAPPATPAPTATNTATPPPASTPAPSATP